MKNKPSSHQVQTLALSLTHSSHVVCMRQSWVVELPTPTAASTITAPAERSFTPATKKQERMRAATATGADAFDSLAVFGYDSAGSSARLPSSFSLASDAAGTSSGAAASASSHGFWDAIFDATDADAALDEDAAKDVCAPTAAAFHPCTAAYAGAGLHACCLRSGTTKRRTV